MPKEHTTESRALRLSIGALITFSLMGILFGVILSSEVIFFDGIFSLLGVATGFITLKISHYMQKNDHFNFPFGKVALEPMAVLMQYLILGGLLAFTLYEAIHTILHGGNKVQLGWVMLYLIINTAIVVFLVVKFRKISAEHHTTLIDSELLQWEISLRQSLWTLGSYGLSVILVWLSFDEILPYIDPAVLIIFILLTFTTIAKEITNAFKEIIGMKTISATLHQDIEDKVKGITQTYHIKDYYLRIRKIGGMVVVEVDFLVDEKFKHGNVYQQDEIREAFEKCLSHIDYELWLSVAFTTQYKWIA